MKNVVFTWEITRNICRADGAGQHVAYGLLVRQEERTVWSFPDIDSNRLTVERLAHRLQAACPEPCHWQEIVEDYIAELVSE